MEVAKKAKGTINILLVEDNDVDAMIVERELRGKNPNLQYNILRARTLSEAITTLHGTSVRLVLLDLTLPDSIGLDTLTDLHVAHPDTPVVVLSGYDDEDTAVKALHNGAQDYIIKCKKENSLPRAIRNALERHEIQKELQNAKQLAAGASAAKTAFLANMSHEIRTPLTSILGFTEIALTTELNTTASKSLNAVYKNAEHLLQIINDILDVSKVEAGKLKTESIEFSLFELLGEIETGFKLKALEAGISFGIEYLFPLPQTIQTDPLRLKQIIFNLVGNAIKFTKSGGVKAVVSLSQDQKELDFQVIDTGIGISVEEKVRLFQPFSQADSSTTREFGGTGLGLLISRQLAEMLGGGLDLRSEKGRGSNFKFSICPGDISNTAMLQTLPRISVDQTPAEETGSLMSGRVLVVDDMPDNRELLSYFLKTFGLKVEAAENGEIALEKIQNESFDIVLLDMQMPVLDGYETVKILRKSGYKLPVIAVTASAMSGALKRCIDAGCDDYLRKPFKKPALHAMLSQYIGRSLEVSTSSTSATTLAQLLAEEPFLAPAILGFIERLPTRIETLVEAWNSRDFDEVKLLAHRLAGAELFGFSALGKLAYSTEIAAATESVAELPSLIMSIQNLAEEVVETKDQVLEVIDEETAQP